MGTHIPPEFNNNSYMNGYRELREKITRVDTEHSKRNNVTTYKYYDKSGNILMTQTHRKEQGPSGLTASDEYSFTGTNNIKTVLKDFDADGNVDAMENYSGMRPFVCIDTDDNGSFDVMKPLGLGYTDGEKPFKEGTDNNSIFNH